MPDKTEVIRILKNKFCKTCRFRYDAVAGDGTAFYPIKYYYCGLKDVASGLQMGTVKLKPVEANSYCTDWGKDDRC